MSEGRRRRARRWRGGWRRACARAVGSRVRRARRRRREEGSSPRAREPAPTPLLVVQRVRAAWRLARPRARGALRRQGLSNVAVIRRMRPPVSARAGSKSIAGPDSSMCTRCRRQQAEQLPSGDDRRTAHRAHHRSELRARRRVRPPPRRARQRPRARRPAGGPAAGARRRPPPRPRRRGARAPRRPRARGSRAGAARAARRRGPADRRTRQQRGVRRAGPRRDDRPGARIRDGARRRRGPRRPHAGVPCRHPRCRRRPREHREHRGLSALPRPGRLRRRQGVRPQLHRGPRV